MGRKVAWILSILALLGTGAGGLYNGINEFSATATPLQHTVTFGEVLYGVFGIAAGVALAARRQSAVKLVSAWAVAITYVAAVAALAYAGDDATVGGAIAGGVGVGLISFGVVWCARVTTRAGSRDDGARTAAEASR